MASSANCRRLRLLTMNECIWAWLTASDSNWKLKMPPLAELNGGKAK